MEDTLRFLQGRSMQDALAMSVSACKSLLQLHSYWNIDALTDVEFREVSADGLQVGLALST